MVQAILTVTSHQYVTAGSLWRRSILSKGDDAFPTTACGHGSSSSMGADRLASMQWWTAGKAVMVEASICAWLVSWGTGLAQSRWVPVLLTLREKNRGSMYKASPAFSVQFDLLGGSRSDSGSFFKDSPGTVNDGLSPASKSLMLEHELVY